MYRYSIVLMLLALVLLGCNQATMEVYYKLGGVTIKRIDKPGETSFYYLDSGKYKSSERIWVKYSGINDGFSGYLKFYKNGRVELLSGDGYFQTNVADSNKFAFRRISYEEVILDGSVCVIMLSTRHEFQENASNKTDVEISYKELNMLSEDEGVEPKTNRVTIDLGDKHGSLFLKGKAWGIAGNHEEIVLSRNDSKQASKTDDYIFYASEIFYKVEKDTVVIYAPES